MVLFLSLANVGVFWRFVFVSSLFFWFVVFLVFLVTTCVIADIEVTSGCAAFRFQEKP